MSSKRLIFNCTLPCFFKNAPQTFWIYTSSKRRRDVSTNLSADYFNAYFESVFSKNDAVPCVHDAGNNPGIENVNLSKQGIFHLLNKTNANKW